MEYGILTLFPIMVVIGLSLITKRILESLIIGTFITYIIVDGFDFASGDGGVLPGSNESRPSVGDTGLRFVRQPDRPAGSISWNAWFFKTAWKTLPGTKVDNACNMDHGCSDFRG